MAQPLRGLAPQIPNASLVWNLKNGESYFSVLQVNLTDFSSLVQTGRVVPVAHERIESGMSVVSNN